MRVVDVGDDGGPSADDYGNAIVELKDAGDRRPKLAVGDNPRLVLVLCALQYETSDTVTAALRIIRDGGSHVARPLTRKALELSVTAQWLHAAGDASLDAFFAVHDLHDTLTGEQAIKAGFDYPGELLRARAPSTPEIETLKRFQQVCQATVSGDSIYFLYRALSGGCHATGDILESWLAPDDGPLGLRIERPGDAPERMQMYVLAFSYLWVVSALEANLRESHMEEALEVAAKRIGVPVMLGFDPRPKAAKSRRRNR